MTNHNDYQNAAADNFIKAAGSEGTLLALFLSRMPYETRISQLERYRTVLMNMEFALFVPLNKVDLHFQSTIQKGFTPWANVDATSAFLYGAGYIDKDEFTPLMNWLREIANPGGKIFAGIHNPGEPMQTIEVVV